MGSLRLDLCRAACLLVTHFEALFRHLPLAQTLLTLQVTLGGPPCIGQDGRKTIPKNLEPIEEIAKNRLTVRRLRPRRCLLGVAMRASSQLNSFYDRQRAHGGWYGGNDRRYRTRPIPIGRA